MSDKEEVEVPQAEPVSKNRQHRKPKPWDTDDINKWEVPEFKREDNQASLLAESSFATLFPKYREMYLKEVWPVITTTLLSHGVECVLNLVEGSMTVKTTKKTFDPYIILKARDLIKLLSRSVPYQQAIRIMEDGIASDIIKIGNIIRNKDRFVKRRQRLLGPSGNTLKAIELLTECYVMVQGNTVSVMGPYKGLKQVRMIVIDCLKNIHPIYHIKELMIKKELAKDEKLKGESWDRFLPHFKKKNVKLAKREKTEKKVYTPFPPQQTLRKVDMQIESGEFFLSKTQRDAATLEKKKEAQAAKSELKRVEREKDFIPPVEVVAPKVVVKEQTTEDLVSKFMEPKVSKKRKNAST